MSLGSYLEREVWTSQASSLPLLAEWHELSLTIRLSNSGYSSQCMREEEEDGEGQIEVESERGELKDAHVRG